MFIKRTDFISHNNNWHVFSFVLNHDHYSCSEKNTFNLYFESFKFSRITPSISNRSFDYKHHWQEQIAGTVRSHGIDMQRVFVPFIHNPYICISRSSCNWVGSCVAFENSLRPVHWLRMPTAVPKTWKISSLYEPNQFRMYNILYTRCVWKVSDLRSYLRVGAILRHPDRGILRSSPHLIEPHAPSGASTS